MGERAERYRADLRALADWERYLQGHSGLPGPRANLELVAVVGDEAPPEMLWRLSRSRDEFLALCGTAGLGRLAAQEPARVMRRLRVKASDPRWRVREGVAIALQRFGRDHMSRLLTEMQAWSEGGPFVQRAAVAGLCEPALLKREADAVAVLKILDGVTKSMADSQERRTDGFRALRQALGYGWSVAAAAAPAGALPYFERWDRSADPDVRWVMRSNLGKSRMGRFRALRSSRTSARAGAARNPAR
jgi:hypothetical protein